MIKLNTKETWNEVACKLNPKIINQVDDDFLFNKEKKELLVRLQNKHEKIQQEIHKLYMKL